jgi:uncharacterized protein
MEFNLSAGQWINKPKSFEITANSIRITTEPNTDLWQRSYYGFRNDNAPALMLESGYNFTFTARASFVYKNGYDQCGMIIYQDSDNWFKASVEHETDEFSRLGSVVTNHGYSDWATMDIAPVAAVWYRLSRRGPDFLIESSLDGTDFKQMRIFHLHRLGETTEAMGKLDSPAAPEHPLKFGLYACSPLESSFEAVFDNIKLEDCIWRAH